ncbi:DUF4347 domain-containing protein [Thalassobaculum sp. OXR-137]|uniref:DUF4347 domain-containing protein n=1 Tax=Thalassobaculum sp. OXR-137 TaxID=3100173 RepID=UPI002AC8BB1E|nr:DUF4347 domain-containing protein [Thalassobaculum sp. OXR-137]WPZ35029.1 DUF4347 domain-containing protein [Thalassobaculum sp. OXR-137]
MREADPALNDGRLEVAFVDSSLPDCQTLVAGVKPGLAVVLIDGARDGLSQMAAWGEAHSGYDAIHILTHGSEGALQLGSLTLAEATLAGRRADLATLGNALTDHGDLLLYGCEVAAGGGARFVSALADLVGANVAASMDLTGASALGGTWLLEATIGDVNTPVALTAAAQDRFAAVLAPTTFTLTTSGTDTVTGAASENFTENGYGLTFGLEQYTDVSGVILGYYYGLAPGYTILDGTSQGGADTLKITVSIPGYSFDLQSITLFDSTTGQTNKASYTLTTNNSGTKTGSIDTLSSGIWSTTENSFGSDNEFLQIKSFSIVFSEDFTGADSAPWFSLQNLIVDNITAAPPTVSSIVRATPATETTNASSVTYTVTFSESVTGVDSNDFSVTTTGGTTGALVTNVSGSGTTWTVTVGTGTGDGTIRLDLVDDDTIVNGGATALGGAGASNGDFSTGEVYTIDKTGPTTTIATVAFSADTAANGGTNSDFVTKTASQTISGTLSGNLVSGESVLVSLDNGSNWSAATASVGQNTWSLAGQTLTGSGTLRVKVTDTAGNDGSPYSQAYVLDTTAPTTTVASVAFSADTAANGGTNSDFVTKTASQTVSGTLSGNLASGETVYVSLDNGSNWSAATATVGQSTWSLAGQTLTGSSTLRVKVTDTAGNDGTPYSQAYVLDTTAPTTTVASAAFSADTAGASGTTSDFITKTASQTVSGTLSGNLASGETVYVSLDNGSSWSAATATVGQSTWSLAGQTLTGSSTLRVKVTDAAGNDGSPYSQAYVLDTTAPATPAISSAAQTSNTTPTLTGTAEAGSTVTVTVAGATYTTTATGGNWSVDLGSATPASGTLSLNTNGTNSVSVSAEDAAGNQSATPASQTLTISPVVPLFTGLDGTAAFTEGDTAVVLDGNVTVAQTDLDALNAGAGNYTGTSLTIARNGGANTSDIFGISASGVTLDGTDLKSSDQTFGTFTQTGGTLTVSFTTSTATSALVDTVLQGITYSNTAATPTGSATLNWTFNDGSADATGTSQVTLTNATAASSTAAGFNTTTGVNLSPKVVFDSASETLTITDAGHLVGSTADGGAGTDTLSVVTGSDLTKLASLTGFENLTIASGGTVTMTNAQLNGFTGTITGDGTETITLTDTGTVTGVTLTNIEKLATAADGTAQKVTLSAALANGRTLMAGDAAEDGFVVTGAGGEQSLTGSVGADTLAGGDGNDVLAGGGGNDVFTDTAGNFNGDTISDFAVGDSIVVTGTNDNTLAQSIDGKTAGQSVSISGNEDTTFTGIASASGTWKAVYDDTAHTTTITLVAPASGGGDSGSSGGGSSGGGTIVVTPTTPTTPVPSGAPTTAQTITNTGTTSGSAAIVQDTNNNGNLVTATLPPGTTITSEGPSTAQSPTDAQTTLITSIQARGSSAETPLVSEARTFLTKLGTTTTLDVRTIVPTTTSGTLNDPIVITGTGGGDQSEAFVIDMRSLPSGSTLQLDNIEFASVMGSTTITGGAGNNFVTGDDSSQFISLGVGDDTLYGGAGADTIGSGSGKDILYGNQSNDRVFGGTEEDTVYGGQDQDVVYGNQAADVVYGNAGYDTLYGGQDADTLYGGQHLDLLYGNLGDDVLNGNKGQDTLYGGAGADRLSGGDGADTLVGGAGDDTLSGGRSSEDGTNDGSFDVLDGGAGDDAFYGGEGIDWIYTGTGADLIYIEDLNGFDVVADFNLAEGDRLMIALNVNGQAITSAADVIARASDNADGDVEIDLGGQYVRLIGVHASDLTEAYFGFS